MIGDPEYKIGRPRQLFEGSPKRDVKPISARWSAIRAVRPGHERSCLRAAFFWPV